jgi:RNA polymerase sigma factor (sigma-70 family)
MNAGNADDEALVERARSGDRRALEQLLAGVRDWAYNVIRRVLLNPQESEDATQEVLVKIATNLAGYDPRRATFRTWAYRRTPN